MPTVWQIVQATVHVTASPELRVWQTSSFSMRLLQLQVQETRQPQGSPEQLQIQQEKDQDLGSHHTFTR